MNVMFEVLCVFLRDFVCLGLLIKDFVLLALLFIILFTHFLFIYHYKKQCELFRYQSVHLLF